MMMISIDDQTLTGDNLGRAKKGEKEASVCASNHQVHTARLQIMIIQLQLQEITYLVFLFLPCQSGNT